MPLVRCVVQDEPKTHGLWMNAELTEKYALMEFKIQEIVRDIFGKNFSI